MKRILLAVFTISILTSCSNEPKATPQEVKAVDSQVAKDQAAMDSMEKVIQQQIDAVSEDSLMKVEH